MGHIYTVPMVNQTIVADASLVIIHTASSATAAGSRIQILRASASQQGPEVSDQLGILLGIKASAFGTYTSTTPVSHELGTTAVASAITGGTAGAAGTAGTDASAEGGGTVTTILEEGFNILSGWLWVPTDDERFIVSSDTAVLLKIVGTPATLTGWNAFITYKELN